MTDREKLVDIVCNAMQKDYCVCHCNYPPCQPVKQIVDDLIDNGVTVRQMQKPLTVENLIFFNWEIWREWWIELKSGRIFCAKECKGYIQTLKDEYGKTWRCWTEKPSDEERQAAEWEK